MDAQFGSGNKVEPSCHLLEKSCSYMLRSHASVNLKCFFKNATKKNATDEERREVAFLFFNLYVILAI